MKRLISTIVSLVTLLPSLATQADHYSPASTSIATPNGYTEMLAPAYHGRLLQTGNYGPRRYPSTYHNMQFMAFRNPATGQILYVQTQDPDGQVIDWEVYSSGGSYSLQLTMQSLSGTVPSDFYITDSTLTAATQTEFYRKAARKYKAWAINQKWAKRKASKLDTMATMATAPDLRNVMMTNTVAPYIDPWNGQRTGCWITFWRKYWQYGVDGAVPDYRLGGNASESLASLALMSSKNCAPFPYTNALLWDSRIVFTPGSNLSTLQTDMNEIWTNNPSSRYDASSMIKDAAGQVVGHNSDSTNPMKYICQSSSTWKDTFLNACRTMAADGWQGIYYDQAAFVEPVLCYDSSHGHTPGDPLVRQNGNVATDAGSSFTSNVCPLKVTQLVPPSRVTCTA